MNVSAQQVLNAITLRQLQYFAAVAEEQHFTRAAERLMVAQPSLSRQIKDLEDTLGVDLFVRDTRGVRLTEAGRELLTRTQTIFAMLERTVDAVRSAGAGARGRLRLGLYGPTFYNNVITRTALERFREEAPDVEIISYELFSEQMAPALREGRIDIGTARRSVRAADLESRLIDVERMVVLLRDGDELAAKDTVALAELKGRALVAFPRDLTQTFNERIAEMARQAGVTFDISAEVMQLSSLAYHIVRGDGIALLTESSALFPFPGVTTRRISDPFATMELLAVTRRGEGSPLVLRFLELLESPGGRGGQMVFETKRDA